MGYVAASPGQVVFALSWLPMRGRGARVFGRRNGGRVSGAEKSGGEEQFFAWRRSCWRRAGLRYRAISFHLRAKPSRSEAFHQELREHADLRRLMAPALVGDVDGERGQAPVGQHRHQLAGDDVGVNDVQRLDQDAQPGQRRRADHLSFVGVEHALDGHRLRPRAALEMQHIGIVGQVVDQQVVLAQRIRRGGRAALGQVAGRGGQYAPRLGQLAHGDAGIAFMLARADGHVDAGLDEVGIAVRGHDLHVQVGIALVEFRQRGRDVDRGEGHGCCHAQRAAGIERGGVDGGVGFRHLAHDGDAAPVVFAAHVGQPQASRGALDQPRRQAFFQRVQASAGRRAGHAQPFGGLGQAAQFRDPDEELDLGPSVHAGDFSA